ncbi:hypothetical protein PE36_00275 [Moritella sp. PE36]|uniref:hypothetical protein n=1 Tax=Moritella sp. PE36 TaxID=58051 RepID=UPI00015693D3|nr:hypothetical protein [Moritella sp. PE36]EDM66186.1 hypothetical protein PE36_00275 [Moritella sp. PE36]
MTIQSTTQRRFRATGVDIVGYNSYINDRAGVSVNDHLLPLGWTGDFTLIEYLNAKSGNPDVTGASCLYLNDTSASENPQFQQPIDAQFISKIFNFGGEIVMVNKCDQSEGDSITGSCAWTWGWGDADDPRAPLAYFAPSVGSGVTGTYMALQGADIEVVAGGYVEFDAAGISSSVTNSTFFLGEAGNGDGIFVSNNPNNQMSIRLDGSGSNAIASRNTANTRYKIEIYDVGGNMFARMSKNNGAFSGGVNMGVPSSGSLNINRLLGGISSSGNRSGSPIAIINLNIKETPTSTVRSWDLNPNIFSDTLNEIDNGVDTPQEWIIQNYDESNWLRAGSKGRMLIWGGNDGTNYGWSVSNSTLAATMTIDNNFHDVRVLIKPSPDGLNWGDAALRVDGVTSSYESNWVNAASNSESTWSIQSGSGGGVNRKSKHILAQLSAYEDNRHYDLNELGFHHNAITGIIGLADVTIDLATAELSTDCSIFEIDLLEDTQITITGMAGPNVIVNENNVGGIRRIYMIKDPVTSEFTIMQLQGA